MKDSAIIIRSLPYSDNTRIAKCFTAQHGVVPVYVRTPKKPTKTTNLMRSGSFVDLELKSSHGKNMYSLVDCKWNTRIPPSPLEGRAMIAWLLALELLAKSIPEELPLPDLHLSLCKYYVYLSEQTIQPTLLTPLVIISKGLGVSNCSSVSGINNQTLQQELALFGITPEVGAEPLAHTNFKSAFYHELALFQTHFGIAEVSTLDLVVTE